MTLRNMVFQGTVWGPSLWNAFFGDCVFSIHGCGFEIVICADDCNSFKSYPRGRSNDFILSDIREVQRSLHTWGQANSVTFDAGKEEAMIIATSDPFGGPTKLLGIDYDSKLSMRVAVHKCAVKAAWKSKALLRCRRFCNTVDLVMLYKAPFCRT